MIAGGGQSSGEQGWRGLYLVGAAAALIAAVFFRRYCSAELSMLHAFGVLSVDANMAPIRAQEWFDLFQVAPLVGLILFDVLDLVNYALIGLIYLALFGALWRQNAAAVTVALAAGLVGIAVYFASNQAFAMFALSRQYAQAATEAQQTLFVAAGEALLAMTYPGGPYPGTGIGIALFLVTVAGLIFAVLMHRCPAFGRAAAWTGILAHTLMLLLFVALAVAPAWSPLPPSLSAVFLLAWYLIIAWRLFLLGMGRASR
jgi:hypothetical protein